MEIVEGFSGLDHAREWEERLELAERALDSLWLQRAIYAIERAARAPGLAKIVLRRSRGAAGLEAVAMVELGDGRGRAEASALRLARLIAGGPAHGDGQLGALAEELREVERWFSGRPGMLGMAGAFAMPMGVADVEIEPGSPWQRVADAIGAPEAKAMMERAQIGQAAGAAGPAEPSEAARRL